MRVINAYGTAQSSQAPTASQLSSFLSSLGSVLLLGLVRQDYRSSPETTAYNQALGNWLTRTNVGTKLHSTGPYQANVSAVESSMA